MLTMALERGIEGWRSGNECVGMNFDALVAWRSCGSVGVGLNFGALVARKLVKDMRMIAVGM